jgi:polysaccharide export outer membrane protein
MSVHVSARAIATLTLVLACSAAARAQTPRASAQAQSKPPAQTPYKPDFVIPKPDGPSTSPGLAAPASPSEAYIIGSQDNLAITVVDEAELTGKYRVDSDGSLTFPYLGRVQASGLTLEELQTTLVTQLKAGYLRNPQIRVEVDQYKSRNVYVIGEVRSPGKVTMSGVTMTLLEALALAGSPTPQASDSVIVVHPSKRPSAGGPTPAADADGERITVNRKDLELGRAGLDVVLQDGDLINVPAAQHFYISGFVRNPGTYILTPGMTVDQAIALAGGLNERGSDRRISVKRVVNGRVREVGITLDDKVQANDTINIPSRFF